MEFRNDNWKLNHLEDFHFVNLNHKREGSSEMNFETLPF